MTRFRMGLPLVIGVCLTLAAVACVKSETEQTAPLKPPVASSASSQPAAPIPDIRATVVAEITATAVAATIDTPTPSPTATKVLPVPPGAFFSVGHPTPLVTPTQTPTVTAVPPVPQTPSTSRTQTPIQAPLPASTPTLASMVEDISPSVVQIITPDGNGSGFVINNDGLVVTNAHVVQGLSTVEVRFTGGRTYMGSVLGVDEVADVALLDVRAFRSLKPVTLGDSDEIMVGEDVIVMGFPLGDTLGASPTITRGIVSAKRPSRSDVTLLQTDAAINPGNSGGPLLGRDGRVVGVNTSKLFRADDGRPVEGIGLAVSINDVRDRLASLARGESVHLDTSPALGTRELHDALGDLLPRSFEELDPAAEELSLSDLEIDEYFSDLVAYATADPLQLIVAATGELSDLERIALQYEMSDPDSFLNDVYVGALLESLNAEEDISIDGFELLELGQIGDEAIGVWLDFVLDGIEMRLDLVMFVQDNYAGMAWSLYFPMTDPSISVEEIARAVSDAIVERAD